MNEELFGDLLVIDCASFIAGPAAATILSDFGARVIKVEPPGLGDSYRNLFRMRGDPELLDYFWTLDSRNKESLALDLKRPEARHALDRLIARADVFITNFPFPVRARLRLRAEDVMAINPRLIYASVTPYGERGPERDLTGYDATAWWARSGLMDMVRDTADAPHAMSVSGMGDHPTAVALYGAIVTALYRREKTGKGAQVSTSLMANGLWSNACQVQAALCGYELAARQPRGQRPPTYGEVFRAQDGRAFTLCGLSAWEWPNTARAIGREELIDDPRFSEPAARVAHATELLDLFDDIFATAPLDDWRARFAANGVTFGVLAGLDDHLYDPQIEANDYFREFADGEGLRTVDSPFALAELPKSTPRMAPSVGQHTRAILEEFGVKPDVVDALLGH